MQNLKTNEAHIATLVAESGTRRQGDQMLRGFGHVVTYLALKELRQNALRGSATVKALLAVQRRI